MQYLRCPSSVERVEVAVSADWFFNGNFNVTKIPKRVGAKSQEYILEKKEKIIISFFSEIHVSVC